MCSEMENCSNVGVTCIATNRKASCGPSEPSCGSRGGCTAFKKFDNFYRRRAYPCAIIAHEERRPADTPIAASGFHVGPGGGGLLGLLAPQYEGDSPDLDYAGRR